MNRVARQLAAFGPGWVLVGVGVVVSVAAIGQGCGPPRGSIGGGGGGGGGGNLEFADAAMSDVDLAMAPPCSGLTCLQVNCGELSQTTLNGTVYAPNGTLPLYNAVVYILNAKVTAFTDGLSCDRCNGQVSGSPLVLATTGPDGRFSLVNVPAGDNIPLVVQLGKWRRQVSIPHVPQCTTTKLDAKYTSLPSNHKEGDIPRMAIATGSADPMECLLLKIGLDPNEIKEPGNKTRVEFYKAANSPGTSISGNTPSAADPSKGLYASLKRLVNYDIVMLPCEGSEYDQSVGRKNLVDFVNMGGRVFATHYSYDWLTYDASPFNKIAKPTDANGLWPKRQTDFPSDAVTTTAKLVTNFPKGMAFAKWLKFAGATSAPGFLDILAIRHDINGVAPALAQAWATDSFTGTDPMGNPTTTPGTPQLTFNTPVDPGHDDAGVAEYCGRIVYSDFHVAQSEANQFNPFPGACMLGPMSDQEKALAFMLFDLSSCVQSDQAPPIF